MKEYKSNIDKISLKREKSDFKRCKIKSSDDVNTYSRNFYHEDLTIYESFFLILLNNSNNTIGYFKVSQGGTAGTFVDVKIIANVAVNSLANAVVLVHNHPSGGLKPSQSDRNITNKIKKGLELLDIKVLDHVILTEDSFYSFADEGIL